MSTWWWIRRAELQKRQTERSSQWPWPSLRGPLDEPDINDVHLFGPERVANFGFRYPLQIIDHQGHMLRRYSASEEEAIDITQGGLVDHVDLDY